mgnify:CR=1 FL=1
MTFLGAPRGRAKVLNTIRIKIDNTNSTGNATIYYDSGYGNGQSGGVGQALVTFYPGTWLPLYATGGTGVATSTVTTANSLEVFDSNGVTGRIGTGAPSSQVDLLLNFPGGNGYVPVMIPAGTQLWVQPTAAPSVGAEFLCNFYD